MVNESGGALEHDTDRLGLLVADGVLCFVFVDQSTFLTHTHIYIYLCLLHTR